MIIFKSILPTVGDVSLLVFENELGAKVEIPVENKVAKSIGLHLEKIKTNPVKSVERGNEDPSE